MQHEIEFQRMLHKLPHMGANARIPCAVVQKIHNIVGVYGVQMNAEASCAVADFAADDGILAQRGVARAKTAALRRSNGNAPLHAFFHTHVAALEQIAQRALQAQGRAVAADEQLRQGHGGQAVVVIRVSREAEQQMRRPAVAAFQQAAGETVLPFGIVEQMIEMVSV